MNLCILIEEKLQMKCYVLILIFNELNTYYKAKINFTW